MCSCNCNINRPLFALEIPIDINENYSCVLKNYWGANIISATNLFCSAQNISKEYDVSFLSLYFNLNVPPEADKAACIDKCEQILQNILDVCTLPLMIRLSGNAKWDVELASGIFRVIDREVIISPVQSANYKQIIELANNTGFKHTFVMRTPIDINLTKELNILSVDEGVSKNKILIDPDMGCIGYGIDYGYSIIERICLARNGGDKMLDMPIVVYAGEESYKAKETKSSDFPPSWGDLDTRAKMWELATASALIAAGANIVVCWHPYVLNVLKSLYCEVRCQ